VFLSRLIIGENMDNKNWKSITVNIDDYHAVRGISKMKSRKLSGTIIKLINDYIKNVAKDNKEDYASFRKKLIKMSKNGG